MRTAILLTSFVLLPVRGDAADARDFRSGVHIQNRDRRAYVIAFEHPLSTSLCWVKAPIAGIRNGIASVPNRRATGFLPDPTKATLGQAGGTLAAGARVLCLCTRSCRVKIEGVADIVAPSGTELTLEDGKLSSAPL